MRRWGSRLTGVVLFLAVLAVGAWAAQQGPIILPGQQPPSPQQPQLAPIPEMQKPLQVQVEMVHLYATVRDKHGAIVPNLTASDFRVFEDGKQQKIAYFTKEMNLPLTLAILVDTSGSQTQLLGAEKVAAKRFLKQVLRPSDLALVMSFDTDVNLLADLTDSTSILDEAIDRTRINAPAGPPMGSPGPFPSSDKPIGTDFYDAVYLAAHDKLAGQAGRKAIIALTDAQDYGSQETLDDAIEAAQLANTVVHVVLVANPWEYINMGGYVGGAVAQKMASQTGGVVIRASNERQMSKAFDQLAEELRSQYVIGYYPTNPARDGTFRKIKVEMTTPEHYRVLTRDGYYAPTQ
ncbi:MAG TPA: VWA domain-containing protein [Candidatus Dormibacteraeota bacterium]|nr:VWA domain-containing protein [Candidatus Dormibacteraeota bacterium]